MFESEAKALAVARANLERAVDQLAKANGDISNADQRIAALVARRTKPLPAEAGRFGSRLEAGKLL